MHDNIDSSLEDEEIAYCEISQYAIPGKRRCDVH